MFKKGDRVEIVQYSDVSPVIARHLIGKVGTVRKIIPGLEYVDVVLDDASGLSHDDWYFLADELQHTLEVKVN